MSWWKRFIRWLLRLLGLYGVDRRPKPASNLTLEIEMGRATINWSLPTERMDGVPLAFEEVLGSHISMSADGGVNFGPEVFRTAVVGVQEFIVDNLTAGTYTVRVVIEDTDDRRADDADVTGSILAAPKPAANLTMTFD
jgi:hypothetical protein